MPIETPSDKPTDWNLSFTEDLKKKADEAAENASPEIRQTVEKTSSFIERNQKELVIGLVILVGLRVHKRKVAKETAKAVIKAMKKQPLDAGPQSILRMHDILDELRATPGMAYIPHGGGMVHLLKGRDAIVTIFGDFEKMTNEEIWKHVGNILNLNIRV